MTNVVIKSINRDQITQAAHQYAQQLRRDFAEITRIIWFGSWVYGHPRPGSDVDICLILAKSDIPARDRISAYLPVGIDLFVYT